MGKGNEMIQRGQFTHEMRIAATLLALPKNERPLMKDIAVEANVSERQLRNWKKEERFQALIQQNVMRSVREALPEVTSSTIEKASEGSAKHQELFYKLLGMLTDRHQHEVTQDTKERHDISSYDRVDEELTRELNNLKEMIGDSKEIVIEADFEQIKE